MSRPDTIVSKITKRTELNKGPMNTNLPNESRPQKEVLVDQTKTQSCALSK